MNNYILRILYTSIFLCCQLLLFGQSHDGSNVTYQFNSYHLTVNDGLADNYVRSIVQDASGFLWLGTTKGLSRYDGYTIRNYMPDGTPATAQMLDYRIQSLKVWGKRYLWVRHRGDLYSCLDLQTNSFVDYTGNGTNTKPYKYSTIIDEHRIWQYDPEHGLRFVTYDEQGIRAVTLNKSSHGLPSDHITTVRGAGDGRVYVAMRSGLALIDSTLKVSVLNRTEHFAYINSIDSTFFFVTPEGAIYQHAAGKLTKVFAPSTPITVTGVAALQHTLLLTTKGSVMEYDTHTRQLTVSREAPYQNCHVINDNLGNDIVCNDLGDVFYINRHDHYRTHYFSLFDRTLFLHNGSPRYQVLTAHDGCIWISIYGNGLFAYGPREDVSVHFRREQASVPLLRSDHLLAICEDNANNIWVGEEFMGATCISYQTRGTDLVFPNATQQPDHSNVIQMLQRAGDKRIYASTLQGELYSCEDTKCMLAVDKQFGSGVRVVHTDARGTMWVGTQSTGLYVGDRQYRHEAGKDRSLPADRVTDIKTDGKGQTWIACYGGGICMAVPRADGDFDFRRVNMDNAQSDYTRVLMCDHHGRMWAGCGQGIYVVRGVGPDGKADGFHIGLDSHNPMTEEVHDIYEDSSHQVWVASSDGLARFDNRGDKPLLARQYGQAEGLPDVMVNSLIADHKERLWVGTNNGICVYNATHDLFQNYAFTDNMLTNTCSERAACREGSDRLAFGTKYGIIIFSPDIAMDEPTFPLTCTDILVNGVAYSKADMPVNLIDKLTLAYNENTIAIHFSDFKFHKSANTLYSCKLEGYDKEWGLLTNKPVARYTDLPPGSYTLRIKAYDILRRDTPERTLQIVVRPPLWRTWWAYLLYLIILCAVGWFIVHYFRRVNDLRNKVKVEKEVADIKLRFFTDISHEFRTPLTIIQGAMEHIRTTQGMPGSIKQPVSSMQKSVNRMMRLINELLEFRKMQNDKLQLGLQETDIVRFVRDIHQTFYELAANKRITYTFNTPVQHFTVFIDQNKVDTIVYNLLSNALKYTPSGGSVALTVRLDPLSIEVCDTGIGISKDDQQYLFQRFMQSRFTQNSVGVGLNLAFKYAEKHHGSLTFRENPEGGSIFTLTLPTDKSVYDERDFLVADSILLQEDQRQHEDKAWTGEYREMPPVPLNMRPVLVVEDDNDVRDYLQTELRRYFEVATAVDGKEALEVIAQNRPDLIVSDVMMPRMSGFELVKKLKSDSQLLDIPVVLLTAVTGEDNQEKGYGAGADAYIEKPFSIALLVTRCIQLLGQRDKLKQSYAANDAAPASIQGLITEEQDRKFVNILDTWLSNHFTDPNLNVDELADTMGYGRSTFYKKVKTITGMTPNNYIRHLRMEQAKKYLEDDTLTVSEICYKLGISNPFYFSKLFKDTFGMSPSQYRKGGPAKSSDDEA